MRKEPYTLFSPLTIFLCILYTNFHSFLFNFSNIFFQQFSVAHVAALRASGPVSNLCKFNWQQTNLMILKHAPRSLMTHPGWGRLFVCGQWEYLHLCAASIAPHS